MHSAREEAEERQEKKMKMKRSVRMKETLQLKKKIVWKLLEKTTTDVDLNWAKDTIATS